MHEQKKLSGLALKGRQTPLGFTIVELLIVIVVIAILAAVSVMAYSGVQARARDSQRRQDIKTITKAIEMYYIDNGRYPQGLCTADCAVNGGWSTTNDGSWNNLANQLVPQYISSMPSDPTPSIGLNPTAGGATRYGYAYFSNGSTPYYCGVGAARQMYILVYTLETGTQEDTLNGTCATSPLIYSGKSNYRVAVGGS